MSTVRRFQGSFAGGEVTPEFFSRIEDPKFRSGLKTARNIEVLPHGPAQNRAGTGYVNRLKDHARKSRLISFVFSNAQTFCVELGHNYVRFHTLGASLLQGSPAAYNAGTTYAVGQLVSSAGVNYYSRVNNNTGNTPASSPTQWYAQPTTGEYEVPTTYTEDELFDIHYVQSNDVITLVHPSHPVRELRRQAGTQWELRTVAFASALNAPSSPSAVATVGSGSTTYTYVVTSLAADGREESAPTAQVSCNNNLNTSGHRNTISWTAPSTPPSFYNVYALDNGVFGFIGRVAHPTLSLVDDNIGPDLSRTPPIANNPFNAADRYPGAVSYFEQRKVFAGSNLLPLNFWMTRSGTEADLSYSLPYRDDDGISFRMASREASRILHVVPLSDLILLTGSMEARVTSINTDAITPESVSIKPQSYVGANNVQPIIVNNNVLFASARGGHLRELAYNWQANGYITGDLCLRCPHLFDNKQILDMAFAKAPHQKVLTVSSDGRMICLTYVPEQQIGGFTWFDSYTVAGQSVFESVAAVPEGEEDAVYTVVRRDINGATVRYIERFASRKFTTQADQFFVDCGLTYSGAPTTTISGLHHLEGEVVNVLADGAEHPKRTVSSGSITLDRAYSKVQVGLPITADMELLQLPVEGEGAFAQGLRRNMIRADVRVYQSLGFRVGPRFDDNMVQPKFRTNEPYGVAPALKDEEYDILVQHRWDSDGQVCIRQTAPLAMTICGVTREVNIGG